MSYRYVSDYVFHEFPKWVHGKIAKCIEDEERIIAEVKAEAKKVEQKLAQAKEQAIGEMQEALRREKKAK